MKKCLLTALSLTSILWGCAQPQLASKNGTQAASCHAHAHSFEFNSALATFRRADFPAARAAFDEYIKSFPSDPLIVNAYFWKGSAEYALGEYRDAVASLSKVSAASPHRYAPEALLTIGASQIESGNPLAGRATLENLVARFADSDAAVRAREKLGLPFVPPAANGGERMSYAAQVGNAIRQNIVYIPDSGDNPTTEVTLRTGCNGEIVGSKVTQPSGAAEWDKAVMNAIVKTKYLPRDIDGLVPPTLVVRFRSR